MSSPPNRLANYRSYSYHHVLVMCDCSETADALSLNTHNNVWKHADQNTADTGTFPQLGKYAPKRLRTYDSKGVPNGYRPGIYCVLINGMTDAAYTITHAEWTCATAADAVHGDRTTSVAMEGSMSISEPKGVVFLDQMIKCGIALGVDIAQVVFVLKTFFVGYATDSSGADTVDYISDISPIQFIVYDVTGSFTESGGAYKMEFVPCVNGATRLPQYSKVATAINITAGESLESCIAALEKNIKDNYKKYFTCVVDTVGKALDNDDPINKVKYIKMLRQVDYKVQLGKGFRTAKGNVDPSYVVTDKDPRTKDVHDCNGEAKYHAQPNTSIETAIHDIMFACKKVKDDMLVGVNEDGVVKKYEYKVHTALQSVNAAGGKEYTVIYVIDRFQTPSDVAMNFTNYQTTNGAKPEDDLKVKANIIAFDYIYTGKNIDILEFDMKVNMGMAYLQTASISNSYASPLHGAASRQTVIAPDAAKRASGRMSNKPMTVPILFGTEIQIPSVRNTNSATTSGNAAYTLTKHSSLEMSEASMTIVGNTRLLGTLNSTSSPTNLLNTPLSEAKATTITTTDPVTKKPVRTPVEANYVNWGFVPAFARVTVKMPRNNDDISLMSGENGHDYAVNFWYDGLYYVYMITNIFDEGVFTQTFNMLSVPPADIFKTASGPAANSQSPKALTFPAQVDSCFDYQPACQSSATSAPNTGGAAVNNVKSCDDTKKAEDDKKLPNCNPAQTPASPTK